MNNQENMIANIEAIRSINPQTRTWVYRNGIKALPWFTSVRVLLEDPSYWGYFMPYANCSNYECGPNATQNLYHDFEQTPGVKECAAPNASFGVECGEYVFNHRNASLRSFLLGDYFFGPDAAGNPLVDGFYVDDGWGSSGPSEMDSGAVKAMGMTPADVTAMVAAWTANQDAWMSALLAAGKFTWGMFYGGQQTAPGQNQTCGQCTCKSYLETNCGPGSGSQNGTLFYGFSRNTHTSAWPLPSPEQDLAMFLLSRGPYAYFGYGV